MRVGLGWEGKPGTCGTLGPTEDMDEGTFPNPTAISLPLGDPSPMGDTRAYPQIPDPFFLGVL